MFVKVCGITSEEDALLAVACGADAVGFIMAPSKRQVSPIRVADIVKRLPPEVLTVGVFKNETPERIRDIVNLTHLKAVQLHGAETPAIVQEVKQHVHTVFKVVAPGSEAFERVRRVRRGCDHGGHAWWRDRSGSSTGGSRRTHRPSIKLIMAGGLNPANVADAIEKIRPWGVDAATGTERSPGREGPHPGAPVRRTSPRRSCDRGSVHARGRRTRALRLASRFHLALNQFRRNGSHARRGSD